jgi:hypothetical protein
MMLAVKAGEISADMAEIRLEATKNKARGLARTGA